MKFSPEITVSVVRWTEYEGVRQGLVIPSPRTGWDHVREAAESTR